MKSIWKTRPFKDSYTYLDGVFLATKLLVVLQIERWTVHLARDGSDSFSKFVDTSHEIWSAHVVGEIGSESRRFLCLEIDKLPL